MMSEKLPVERLIDLSVEENILPDRKFHYRWYELGEWQFDTLVQLGLEPQHNLLDVGCGPMRLGQFAIPYLEEGRYFGIDAYPPYIRLGNRVLEECGITRKRTVIHSTTFEFEKLDAEFDFAVAQSVFTHLSGEQVYVYCRCWMHAWCCITASANWITVPVSWPTMTRSVSGLCRRRALVLSPR